MRFLFKIRFFGEKKQKENFRSPARLMENKNPFATRTGIVIWKNGGGEGI